MKFKTIIKLLLPFISVVASVASFATPIQQAKVNIIDEFGVNLVTGQVTASVDTVSIGGGMGLSHAIFGHTNNFNFKGDFGYGDSFEGAAVYKALGKKINWDGRIQDALVMRVWGPGGMHDFVVYSNNVRVRNAYSPPSSVNISNYVYQALGDRRHTLEVNPSNNKELLWIHPDGTVYVYMRGSSKATAEGRLLKIIEPNGFEITTRPGGGVHTNTGYQLFYGYKADNRLPSNVTRNAFGKTGYKSITNNSNIWARSNPAFIKAINNTVEYCEFPNSDRAYEISTDNELAADCEALNNDWPTATFTWPAGMPLAFYAEENELAITDAEGGVTRLHFKPYDLTNRNPYDPIDEPVNVIGQVKWSPRLAGITPPGANEQVWTYEYENAYYETSDNYKHSNGSFGLHYQVMSTWLFEPAGVVRWATGPKGRANYANMGVPTGPWDNEVKNTGLYKGNKITKYVTVKTGLDEDAPGSIFRAYLQDQGDFFYDYGGKANRGFIRYVQYFDKPRRDYKYDSRNNLEKITIGSNLSNPTTIEADYPPTCTAATRRKCNKPLWVKDANGHRTDYRYHESGQLERVTEPADRNGIRPQTRYEYAQLSARFYNPVNKGSLGQLVSGSPIWLKTREAFCRTSVATENGCSAPKDEVVTEYDYGPTTGVNNLHLRGITVTAAGEQPRRTCYSYDIYGNRIGETSPNAAKTSCY